MKNDEVWLSYVNEHLDPTADMNDLVKFRVSETLERFFDLHPMFTKRWDAISSTPFNSEFDEVADIVLFNLSMSDNFDSWEHIPAGAWRVLSDRLQYCEIVLTANMVSGDPIIDRLPQGLDKHQQTIALLLKYLLGHGRTIDRDMLPEQPSDKSKGFPSQQPLRSQ